MKKLMCILAVVAVMLALAGCKTKVLHCDHCNKEVSVKADSNMEEDWIIYCKECNDKLFGDQ